MARTASAGTISLAINWVPTVRRAAKELAIKSGPGPDSLTSTTPLRSRLLDERLQHGCLERPVHDLTARQLNHQNRHQLVFRVYPEVRAERPVPAETAVGAKHARLNGIHHDLDRQAESHSLRTPQVARKHIADVVGRH